MVVSLYSNHVLGESRKEKFLINKTMPEKFEGGEKPKNFSEDEVKKSQDLIRKVREVVEWDLGKMCSTTEEIDLVDKAKDAMKDIEALFHVPKTKFWAEIPGKDMAESCKKAQEYNTQLLPNEVITFHSTDLDKLRADLKEIDEVLGWDIGASDETEITMIREARESLEALRNLL